MKLSLIAFAYGKDQKQPSFHLNKICTLLSFYQWVLLIFRFYHITGLLLFRFYISYRCISGLLKRLWWKSSVKIVNGCLPFTIFAKSFYNDPSKWPYIPHWNFCSVNSFVSYKNNTRKSSRKKIPFISWCPVFCNNSRNILMWEIC